MNIEEYGFKVYTYGKYYMDYIEDTICTECGTKHINSIIGSVEYHTCEKVIECKTCNNSLLYSYGHLLLGLAGTFYNVKEDGTLILNDEV